MVEEGDARSEELTVGGSKCLARAQRVVALGGSWGAAGGARSRGDGRGRIFFDAVIDSYRSPVRDYGTRRRVELSSGTSARWKLPAMRKAGGAGGIHTELLGSSAGLNERVSHQFEAHASCWARDA